MKLTADAFRSDKLTLTLEDTSRLLNGDTLQDGGLEVKLERDCGRKDIEPVENYKYVLSYSTSCGNSCSYETSDRYSLGRHLIKALRKYGTLSGITFHYTRCPLCGR